MMRLPSRPHSTQNFGVTCRVRGAGRADGGFVPSGAAAGGTHTRARQRWSRLLQLDALSLGSNADPAGSCYKQRRKTPIRSSILVSLLLPIPFPLPLPPDYTSLSYRSPCLRGRTPKPEPPEAPPGEPRGPDDNFLADHLGCGCSSSGTARHGTMSTASSKVSSTPTSMDTEGCKLRSSASISPTKRLTRSTPVH